MCVIGIDHGIAVEKTVDQLHKITEGYSNAANGNNTLLGHEEEDYTNFTRVRGSSVHEHFDEVQIINPNTKKHVKGASCKYCKFKFLQKNTTNLKRHLKVKHPQAFEEVIHQDKEKYAFVVVGDDVEKEGEDDNEDETGGKVQSSVENNHANICLNERLIGNEDEEANEDESVKRVTSLVENQIFLKKSLVEDENEVGNEAVEDIDLKVESNPDPVRIPLRKLEKYDEFEDDEEVTDEDETEDYTDINDKDDINRAEERSESTIAVNFSSVHEHFDKMELQHPVTKETVIGAMCKYCRKQLISRNSTSLKTHLRSTHPEAFDEVFQKDKEKSSILVVGCDSDFNKAKDDGQRNGDEDGLLEDDKSTVHDHFEQVMMSNPTTQITVKGSICKYCRANFFHRLASGLRDHLKRRHPEAFDENMFDKSSDHRADGRPKYVFGKDEFVRMDDFKTKTGRNNYMVKCKHCDNVMAQRTFKAHLRSKHREVYNRLQAEYRANMNPKAHGFRPKQYSKNAYFKCQKSKCKFSTNYQRKFDRHLFDEHLETTCQTCGIPFTHYNEYYKHLLTHVVPIHCNDCNKQFLDKTRYDYHIKMGHRDEATNGFCPTCGKYFPNVSMHCRNVHIKGYYAARRQHHCPHCDYKSGGPKDLKLHIKNRHTKADPINCPWCGALTKHLDDHLRRQQCNVPEEERKFKPKVNCNYCGREFKNKGKLNQHISQIHEIVYKYCDKCDYKTSTAGNLRLHIKRQHEGKPLKEECQICNRMTISIEGHMKIYHGDLVNKTK